MKFSARAWYENSLCAYYNIITIIIFIFWTFNQRFQFESEIGEFRELRPQLNHCYGILYLCRYHISLLLLLGARSGTASKLKQATANIAFGIY